MKAQTSPTTLPLALTVIGALLTFLTVGGLRTVASDYKTVSAEVAMRTDEVKRIEDAKAQLAEYNQRNPGVLDRSARAFTANEDIPGLFSVLETFSRTVTEELQEGRQSILNQLPDELDGSLPRSEFNFAVAAPARVDETRSVVPVSATFIAPYSKITEVVQRFERLVRPVEIVTISLTPAVDIDPGNPIPAYMVTMSANVHPVALSSAFTQ